MTEIEKLAKELVDCMKNYKWPEVIALKKSLYPKKEPTRQEVIDDLQDFENWWMGDNRYSSCYNHEVGKESLRNAIKELKKPALEWVDYDPDVVPDCEVVLGKNGDGYDAYFVFEDDWSKATWIKKRLHTCKPTE